MVRNSMKLAKEWFSAGESDFLYAQVGLKENEVLPQVGFMAQQAVEKFLKGFLILHGIKPERVHDLVVLLESCTKIEPKLETLRETCAVLTGFYLESRYPPDIHCYSKKDILNAFNNAKLVKEAIEGLIKNEITI